MLVSNLPQRFFLFVTNLNENLKTTLQPSHQMCCQGDLKLWKRELSRTQKVEMKSSVGGGWGWGRRLAWRVTWGCCSGSARWPSACPAACAAAVSGLRPAASGCSAATSVCWAFCNSEQHYLFIDLLKAYSPVDRTGSRHIKAFHSLG